MGSEWKELQLEDCMDAIIDYRGRTPKKTKFGIPLVTAKIIKNGSIQSITEYIAESDYALWMSRGIPLPGDVVMTTEAPLGEVAQLDNRKVALAQRVITLRGKKGLLDNRFLKYLITSQYVQHQLDGRGTGTTVKGIRQSELRKVMLRFPLYSEQKAIAHILGSLDDKIELNRKMNSTLESMAQALFKSWFVDFDPVIDKALAAGNPIPEPLQKRAEIRKQLADKLKFLPAKIEKYFPSSFVFSEELGWIPEGWTTGKLGDYVTVKRGGSPRPIHDFLVDDGLPWVKISDATASKSRFLMRTKQFIKPEGLRKTVLLKKGELILSNSATPGLPKFLNLDACIHDGWLYFPEKILFSDLFLYQLFLVVRGQLLMQGNGSVFTNLKTDILKNHIVLVPEKDLMLEFESRLVKIYKKLLALQVEIQTLTALRNTLLPKLISGELRVPDAEKLVEEAL